MSNNIIIGQNIVWAKQTVPIVSTGITSSNVLIIYEMNATSNPSYVPGRSINGFFSFTSGKAYILKALLPMDLTEYLAPPFPTDNGILLEDGSGILVE